MDKLGTPSNQAFEVVDSFSTMDVDDLFGTFGSKPEYIPDQRLCHTEDEAWGRCRVDLSNFENHMLGEPVFNRELFRQVSQMVKHLKNGKTNKTYTISGIDMDEPELAVWVPTEDHYAPEDDEEYEYVVQILNHVELSPNYELDPGSAAVRLSRKYAEQVGSRTLCPIVISESIVPINKDHLNPAIMSPWTHSLAEMGKAWKKSVIRSKLRNCFLSKLSNSVPIHRITAFGLGAIDDIYGNGNIQHITQYFALFTIVRTLQELHGKKVEIVFQDPSYTQKDRILISSLHPNIKVVDNPSAFALVDSSTLVFSPYVPIGVPILQICADVGPPAGIWTNKVRVSEEQRWFSVGDRTSPRVVKMLKDYARCGFEEYVLDDEIVDLMGQKQSFWLNGMEVYLKTT